MVFLSMVGIFRDGSGLIVVIQTGNASRGLKLNDSEKLRRGACGRSDDHGLFRPKQEGTKILEAT